MATSKITQPLVTGVSTVKQLIVELRKAPAGSTWLADRAGNGWASITVYDKNGNGIYEIVNKD